MKKVQAYVYIWHKYSKLQYFFISYFLLDKVYFTTRVTFDQR